MDLGVDGFRMDSVAHLFESTVIFSEIFMIFIVHDSFFKGENFEDEEKLSPKSRTYSGLNHKYTHDLPEVLDLLRRFRDILDEKTKEDEYNPR